MPYIEEHCHISYTRTKKNYLELHKWIDEGQKQLEENHRLIRHSYNEIDREYIKENFGGQEAVIEWLIHIALDNLQTAYKTSKFVYQDRAWNHYEIKFDKNGRIEYFGEVRKDDEK